MRTIAIVNQKGGCGKTITSINLSAFLAQSGRRVLVVDMDPQGHATLGLSPGGSIRPARCMMCSCLIPAGRRSPSPTSPGRLKSVSTWPPPTSD